MTFTLLTVAVIAVFASMISIRAVKGYKRGLYGSLINLAVVCLSAFSACGLSVWLGIYFDQVILELIRATGLLNGIDEAMPNIAELISMIARMAASLLIFYPLHLLIGLLFRIIFSGAMKRDANNTKRTRGYVSENAAYHEYRTNNCGAIVGAVSGLVASVIIFTPIHGLLSVFHGAMPIIQSYSDSSEEILGDYAHIGDYNEDAGMTMVGALGGDVLYDLIARTKVEGEVTYLSNELEVISKVDVASILTVFEHPEGINEDSIAALEGQLEIAGDSIAFRMLMADVVSTAAQNWMAGEDYMGIPRPDFGDGTIVKSLIDSLLNVFSSSTVKTVKGDIICLLKVCAALSEVKDYLSEGNYNTLMNRLSKFNTIGKIEEILKENSHTAPLARNVNDLVMTALADHLDSYIGFGSERYSDLLANLSESLNSVSDLNDSVKLSAMTDYAKNHLLSYGIIVPESLATTVASSLLSTLEDGNEVNEDLLRAFFANYLGQQ